MKTPARIPSERRLLTFAVVAVLFLAIVPGTSAYTTRFPTQSLGNRGSDVRAAQGLLVARGYVTATDGIFGSLTRLIRKAADQGRWGTDWRYPSYDRTATRALIRAIRAAAPGT